MPAQPDAAFIANGSDFLSLEMPAMKASTPDYIKLMARSAISLEQSARQARTFIRELAVMMLAITLSIVVHGLSGSPHIWNVVQHAWLVFLCAVYFGLCSVRLYRATWMIQMCKNVMSHVSEAHSVDISVDISGVCTSYLDLAIVENEMSDTEYVEERIKMAASSMIWHIKSTLLTTYTI